MSDMNLEISDNIKGLIFDLDGTLIHSMPLHYEAWREVFDEIGFDFNREIFFKTAGMPTEKIFDLIKSEFNLDFDVERLTTQKEAAYVKRMDELKVIDEVAELVYQNYGKRAMSVGTGSQRTNAQNSLNSVGLDKYFTILVAKDDVQQHKPHPETFLKCAELMDVDPKNCHVFEDGDLGIQAARSCGMHVTDIRKHLNQTI